MSVASSLPPSVKAGLRPYWRAFKQLRSAAARSADDLGVRVRVDYMKVKRTFVKAPIPIEAHGQLNLHLGCGRIDHKEFINIDGYPFPNVDYVQAIDRLPQFKTGTVDLIYASHCLEHFHYRETEKVLTEWFRVLKAGGTLRVSVPDFDKLVDIYTAHRKDPDVIIEQLMGGQNNKYNFHYTALSTENLGRMMRNVGFTTVRPWQPGSASLMTFADFSTYRKEVAGNHHEISLNIEAVK